MAINFPGPWQLRLNYSTTTTKLLNHQQRLNCDLEISAAIGSPLNAFTVKRRGAASSPAGDVIAAWATLVAALYNASGTMVNAELWKYTVGTNDAIWYSAGPLAFNGTGAGSLQQGGELIHTYRSTLGGSARLHFMNSLVGIGVADTPPFSVAASEAIRAFVESTNNWILARDNGYLLSAVAAYPGQNEALFKQLFR